MKIVIVGDGKVGSTLTAQLSHEGHDVIVIDSNPAAIKDATDKHDVIGITGNGATYQIQLEAGVDKSDLLIAVTSRDEVNLICCMIAKKLGAKHTIARVRNPEYSHQIGFLKDELRLSMYVNPELASADEISRILRFPSAIKIEPFSHGRVELVELKLTEDNPLIGKALNELAPKLHVSVLVCAVKRGEEVIIPTGDFVLAENDRIYVTAATPQINDFMSKLKLIHHKIKNVMIAGGGRIAYYLARQLESFGMNLKIIESDMERCRELSELLPHATILYGDASNHELLHEEGIESMDAFVALTGFDEENIIISMYAHACNVPKVITKISNINFPSMLDRMGLDTVISPKMIIANQIVRYVRAMQQSEGSSVEALYRIVDDRVEVLEFKLNKGLPFLGIPLKDLKLKKQILIGCIVRKGKAKIATGSSTLEADDNVIVISGNSGLTDINDILE